jgi:hypothetical protein
MGRRDALADGDVTVLRGLVERYEAVPPSSVDAMTCVRGG